LIGMVLLGGWLLLFNPEPGAPYSPTGRWERVRKYETAWLCEEGRREEAARLSERTAKEHSRQRSDTLAAMLRYRCEYTDRTRWQDSARWKLRDWARWRPW
jgi:hypothetical protein